MRALVHVPVASLEPYRDDVELRRCELTGALENVPNGALIAPNTRERKKRNNVSLAEIDQLAVHLILLKMAERSEAKSVKRSFASKYLNF